MSRTAIATLALVASASLPAYADRYEAAVTVAPEGGFAWIREDGAAGATRVPRGGASVRLSYGLRDWLALDAEVGGATMSEGRFEDIVVSVGGATPTNETLTRTTRAARLLVGGELRLGVAWIPTVAVGVGAQLRMRGDAVVAGTALVPDGRRGGMSIDPIVAARAGLERRLSARWVVGVEVAAARALMAPAIDSAEVSLSLSRYWYPLL